MVTKRDFLKAGVCAGSSLFWTMGMGIRSAHAASPYVAPYSPVLTKYMDALPVPPLAIPTPSATAGFYEVGLNMANNSHSFHSQLAAAPTFSYGGTTYLGPTIEARRGQPLKVTVSNNLGAHPLPLLATPDPMNIMGVMATDATAPRTSMHLHGGYTPQASDGGPMDVFSPGSQFVYTYANDQQAANLWYHDHAMGLTRANVYAGLAGNYLLRDEFDTGAAGNPLGLPAPYGVYEFPIVLQDKADHGADQQRLQVFTRPQGG